MGSLNGWYGVNGLISMIFLLMCGQGFTIPNSSALSLLPFSRHTGSASALLGAMQLAMGALASGIVSLLHNGTELPMLIVMAACVVISFLLYLLGTRRSNKVANDHFTAGLPSPIL